MKKIYIKEIWSVSSCRCSFIIVIMTNNRTCQKGYDQKPLWVSSEL